MLLAAGLCVAVVTWPWVVNFHNAIDHWDVGLHAWKLAFNAQRILEGGFWLPQYQANFYYPFSLTLAYDDLFWIPSLVAAVFWGLSHDPLVTYNATFFVFWALPAPLTYLLLRELRLGRAAAAWGALAFTLLPFRTSYYLEFNGHLIFGLPLCFWLLLRLAKRASLARALAAALAFWAQAVSALYFAVMITVVTPFLALAFWRGQPQLVRQPGLARNLGLAGLVLVGLCALFLHPYYQLSSEEHFVRSLGEMADHAAQPLAYLLNASVFTASPAAWQPHLPAQPGEVILWAGWPVALLAALGNWRERCLEGSSIWMAEGRERNLHLLAFVRALAWLVFAVWVVASALTLLPHHQAGRAADWGFNLVCLTLLGCSLAMLWLRRPASWEQSFLSGLGLAAVLCFFLSLGPYIEVGGDIRLADNLLVRALYDWVPLVRSTRVVSRYALVPLFFLVVYGAFYLHRLEWRPALKWGLALAGLALMWAEVNLPEGGLVYAPAQVRQTAQLEAFLRGQEPCSLAALPMGLRELDSQYMMAIAGVRMRRYLLNGWTGFNDDLDEEVERRLNDGHLDQALDLLRQVWPRPLIVVERGILAHFNHNGGYAVTLEGLAQACPLLHKDKRFSVFAIPDAPLRGESARALLRADLLRQARGLEISARLAQAPEGETAPAQVCLNGRPLGRVELGGREARFSLPLDGQGLTLRPNEISLRRLGDGPGQVELLDLRLLGLE